MHYQKPSLEIEVIELDIITASQITEVESGGSEGKDFSDLFF